MAGRKKSSEISHDIEGRNRSTKSRGTEQRRDSDSQEENYNHDVDNLIILTTGLLKAAKKLKVLQKDITRKQKKVDSGRTSKELKGKQESYSATLKDLCIYVPQLQPILDNTKDRTGPPDTPFRKSYSLNEKHTPANRGRGELESDRDYLSLKNTQLTDENLRLKKELEESKNEKAALNVNHKEEMGVLKNELRDLKERIKAQEQVQHKEASTELEGKEDYKILKKKLEESEHEIKKWKNQYNSLMQEKRTIEEELQRSAEAKIYQLTRQLEEEKKDNEAALLRKSEEYMKEKSTLQQNYQEKIQNLQEEIQRLKERTKKQEQLQRQVASTEQKENDILKEECKRLNRTLEESENEKVALKVSHKEEIGAHKEEIRKLKERLAIDKSSYEKREKELKTKCDGLEADITSYKTNWTKSEDANIQLEIKITELEKKSKEGEREIKTWKNRYNSLEEEKRRTEEELKRLEAKNNQLTNQLENERKAKEDALLRLSSMASNKLRDNNPNIADLSDPNRPTKLSEQFSELYDNEWTDAFDELEKLLGDKEDKEIISYLRDFVLEIHSVCSDISSSKMKTIEEAFVKPSVPSENTKIPTEIFKTIKDGIKSMAPKLLEHTRERVLGHLEEKYFTDPVAGFLQHQNVKRYIDKCTEVCWYMSVQDPQLVMDGSKSPDEKFDSNKHREYTKKGPYEEFVVWPALYLYRGGQMLSKGVAQGGKKEIGQQ